MMNVVRTYNIPRHNVIKTIVRRDSELGRNYDGSPRISPVRPFIQLAQLLIKRDKVLGTIIPGYS